MAGRIRNRNLFPLAAAALLLCAVPAVRADPPVDSDADTISDIDEGAFNPGTPRDTDGDLTPDYLDLDSDNDTVADVVEAGRPDILDPPVNTDALPEYNDSLADYIDIDSDNDGIHDADEAWPDDLVPPTVAEQMLDPVAAQLLLADSERDPWIPSSTVPDPDGIPDLYDQDSDDDLIADYIEAGRDINPFTPPIDTDEDGIPDFRDGDSDGDGTPDVQEWDTDGDFNPNFSDPNDQDGPLGDLDEDLITNLEEGAIYLVSPATGYYVLQAGGRNTDGDSSADFRDGDSDDDGLSDAKEKGNSSLLAPPRRSRGALYDPDYMIPDLDDDGSLDGSDPGPSFIGMVAFPEGFGRWDRDYDDDGIPDGLEGAGDLNGNGVPDWAQLDGSANWESDGDGLWAWDDPDSDEDGIPDSVEAGITASLGDGPGLILGTRLSAGNFEADPCPGQTTNPYERDTDGGGQDDGSEDLNLNGCYEPELGETNPNDPDDDSLFVDPDGDHLETNKELQLGLNPNDSDTDDDGFTDGEENGPDVVIVVLRNLTTVSQGGGNGTFADIDMDNAVNGRDRDSDNDGLSDNLEGCFTLEKLLADPAKYHGIDGIPDTAANQDGTWFIANPSFQLADPLCNNTHYLKVDTDSGGIIDGREDASLDGVTNGFETDPLNGIDDPVVDRDEDGLAEQFEVFYGMSDGDLDSDDDGVGDFDEVKIFRTDATTADTDGDGIFDGTELGVTPDRIKFPIPPIGGTDLIAGTFIPDSDPFTTTNATARDTDTGGAWDGMEDFNRNGLFEPELGETDPLDPEDDGTIVDCDGDGIPDPGEIILGLNMGLTLPEAQAMALDADYDDDGVRDGLEAITDTDTDGYEGIRDPDSDNDNLTDGLEIGAVNPVLPPEVPPLTCGAAAGTFVSSPNFNVDSDPTATTDPLRADSDGGGKSDGQEDFDRNGDINSEETDPNDPADDGNSFDRDGDGLSDSREILQYFSNPDDADTDEDGISDGREALIAEINTSPINPDSDSDGLQDGTEIGLTEPDFAEATISTIFRPDADPLTTTLPRNYDTDGGGRPDGLEDVNKNGRYDPNETNPLDPADDDDIIPEPSDDFDGDGMADFVEDTLGLDKFDWDSDDDGVPDGLENGGLNMTVTLRDLSTVTVNSFQVGRDVDLDEAYNGLDPDADGDGIRDSVEWCITEDLLLSYPEVYDGADGIPDTGAGQDGTWWTDNPDFVLAPADCSKSHILLADTDRGGVNDGLEDDSHDGIIGDGESDPLDPDDDGGFGSIDNDGDGLNAQQEATLGTSDFDTDSDDDGLSDGDELFLHLTNPRSPDSDNDGLVDGLETGVTTPLPALGGNEGTNVALGFFAADGDGGATTTDPRARDTDNGGRSDGSEDSNRNGQIDGDETDPNNPADDGTLLDCDGDGIPNLVEDSLITQFASQFGIDPGTLAGLPNDADFDDDGVSDGTESFTDTDSDNLPGILDPDSDNDGLPDGLESGVTSGVRPPITPPLGCTAAVGTNTLSSHYIVDLDPASTTDRLLADTDGGGIVDGAEDTNRNGKVDASETNPQNPLDDGGQGDSDGDGLSDSFELSRGLNPFDADTDDDGLSDGRELQPSINTNPGNRDTDSDGIQDGTERGLSVSDYPPDTNPAVFIPDLHPTSRTNPRVIDTDTGGRSDGLEDLNHNGRVDLGETNPLDPADDNTLPPGDDDDDDSDGVKNGLEEDFGTDRLDIDSDDDGINDFIEVGGVLVVTAPDPVALDTDEDTVIDALDPDSDNDGILDGNEDIDGNGFLEDGETNRLAADTDKDGVGDLVEAGGEFTFNPSSPNYLQLPDTDSDGSIDARDTDSDNDGLEDGKEDKNGDGIVDTGQRETDRLKGDTDNGGVFDGEEVLKGTDPLNPADDGVTLKGCAAGSATDPTLSGALLALALASLVRFRKRREARP